MTEPTSTFSPDWPGSQSQPQSTESAPSQCASATSSSPPGSDGLGPECRSAATCGSSTAGPTAELGFSQPELLASQPAAPGSSEARQTTAGSGRRLSACLRSQSPLGRCLRTLLESSTWGSTESLLRWEGSATRSNRSLFRLVPLIRHRTGSEFGLWATALKRDSKGVDQNYSKGRVNAMASLVNQLKAVLWPTANCPNGGRTLSPEDVLNKGATAAGKRQVDLRNLLKVVLWRAPTKEDTGRGPSTVEDRIAGGAYDSLCGPTKDCVVADSQAVAPRQENPSQPRADWRNISGVDWRDFDWLQCPDGKGGAVVRRVPVGLHELADGLPSRLPRGVGSRLLAALGNAIVWPVAAEIVKAMTRAEDCE